MKSQHHIFQQKFFALPKETFEFAIPEYDFLPVASDQHDLQVYLNSTNGNMLIGQTLVLIHKLEAWSKNNNIVIQPNKYHSFLEYFNPARTQVYHTYDLYKFGIPLLAQFIHLLNHSSKDKNTKIKTVENVVDKFDACGPGIVTALQNACRNLINSPEQCLANIRYEIACAVLLDYIKEYPDTFLAMANNETHYIHQLINIYSAYENNYLGLQPTNDSITLSEKDLTEEIIHTGYKHVIAAMNLNNVLTTIIKNLNLNFTNEAYNTLVEHFDDLTLELNNYGTDTAWNIYNIIRLTNDTDFVLRDDIEFQVSISLIQRLITAGYINNCFSAQVIKDLPTIYYIEEYGFKYAYVLDNEIPIFLVEFCIKKYSELGNESILTLLTKAHFVTAHPPTHHLILTLTKILAIDLSFTADADAASLVVCWSKYLAEAWQNPAAKWELLKNILSSFTPCFIMSNEILEAVFNAYFIHHEGSDLYNFFKIIPSSFTIERRFLNKIIRILTKVGSKNLLENVHAFIQCKVLIQCMQHAQCNIFSSFNADIISTLCKARELTEVLFFNNNTSITKQFIDSVLKNNLSNFLTFIGDDTQNCLLYFKEMDFSTAEIVKILLAILKTRPDFLKDIEHVKTLLLELITSDKVYAIQQLNLLPVILNGHAENIFDLRSDNSKFFCQMLATFPEPEAFALLCAIPKENLITSIVANPPSLEYFFNLLPNMWDGLISYLDINFIVPHLESAELLIKILKRFDNDNKTIVSIKFSQIKISSYQQLSCLILLLPNATSLLQCKFKKNLTGNYNELHYLLDIASSINNEFVSAIINKIGNLEIIISKLTYATLLPPTIDIEKVVGILQFFPLKLGSYRNALLDLIAKPTWHYFYPDIDTTIDFLKILTKHNPNLFIQRAIFPQDVSLTLNDYRRILAVIAAEGRYDTLTALGIDKIKSTAINSTWDTKVAFLKLFTPTQRSSLEKIFFPPCSHSISFFPLMKKTPATETTSEQERPLKLPKR